MTGEVLRGVEILREQRGRHDERRAGVREALARRAVHGELACRVERFDARKVAEGVGVFGVREAAQHDGTGVARAGQRDVPERAARPRDELGLLRGGELRLVLRRHLAEFQLLLDLLPDLRVVLHDIERLEPLQIKIALVRLGRVALHAELVEERADFLLKVRGGLTRRVDGEQQRGQTRGWDEAAGLHGRGHFTCNFATSLAFNARLNTAISSSRPSQFDSLSLRPPRKHWSKPAGNFAGACASSSRLPLR